ncbi:hypothetical protein DFH09DRAFT_1076984 [Mycena vulgaris]|nr:hypothetical protein DFH09DRAFT_1076984 [Mycena vulgaris]
MRGTAEPVHRGHEGLADQDPQEKEGLGLWKTLERDFGERTRISACLGRSLSSTLAYTQAARKLACMSSQLRTGFWKAKLQERRHNPNCWKSDRWSYVTSRRSELTVQSARGDLRQGEIYENVGNGVIVHLGGHVDLVFENDPQLQPNEVISFVGVRDPDIGLVHKRKKTLTHELGWVNAARWLSPGGKGCLVVPTRPVCT